MAPATWVLNIPIAFRVPTLNGSSSHFNFWPTEKSEPRALQGVWGSLHKFISFSHTRNRVLWILQEWMCMTYMINTLYIIPILLNLWIPSSIIYQGNSDILNSFSVGHLLIHISAEEPSKPLEPFLTPWTPILYVESLHSGPILTNVTRSSFIFLPPLSSIFHIHPQTCSPKLCLHKLEKSCCSFRV